MVELYCVLHKDPAYSREKTLGFLAQERCISRDEAVAAFQESPGFLLENASLAKASAFNLRASAYGFETLLLSHKDLRNPPPPLPVSKIEPKTEGFYFTSGVLKDHIPAKTVRALAACAYDVEIPPKDTSALETGFINSLRARYFPSIPPLPQPPSAKETVFTADIITDGPMPLRLSLPCDGQDYSGLGPLKALSSLENFRVLLDELSARAFGAGNNRFLEALLKGEQLTPLKSPSPEAYEKELIWLLTIKKEPKKEPASFLPWKCFH